MKTPWTFHRVLLKLHLWTGLASAIFLLILGVTGGILEFEPEVNRAQPRPAPVVIQPQGQALPVSELLAGVQKTAPRARVFNISFGSRPSDPYRVSVLERKPGKAGPPSRRTFMVNQYTGEITPNQDPVFVQTGLGRFMLSTRNLHRTLWAGNNGRLIVNYATLVGIFLILTGIILWWPRKILWTTKGASWRRFNFDLHSVVGIYSMVFFFIISITGSMIHWRQMGDWIVRAAHQQIPNFGQAHSTPPGRGARPLSLDELLAKADANLPGNKTMFITLAQRPVDPVFLIRSGSGPRSEVLCSLDQYSGRPLVVDDPVLRPWAVRLVRATVGIHEGTYFGLTGRIIACVTSTAIPVMVVTGFIIWWKRKLTEWGRRRARGRSLTKQELEDLAEDEREDLDRVSASPQPIAGRLMQQLRRTDMRALPYGTILPALLALGVSLFGEDIRVKQDELPATVRDTIEKLADGYQFGSAKKITDSDGSVKYEVNLSKDKKGLRVVAMADGKLYETRETPALAEVPDAAREVVERASSGEPDMMVKITRPGAKTFYRFRTTRIVAADGSVSREKYLGNMAAVKADEVPEPVRNTIEKLIPGVEWFAIKLSGSKAEYGPSYEIRAKNATFLILSPEGKLYERWDLSVKLANTPEPVAKAVERATQGGPREPENLIKIMPMGGDPYYLFRLTRDVAEDGTVLPKQNE